MALQSQSVNQLPVRHKLPMTYNEQVLTKIINDQLRVIKALQADIKALDAQLNP